MSGNASSVVIGQYVQEVRYCGARTWNDYAGKNGPVRAGGMIVTRYDGTDKQTGEKVHSVEEHRMPVEFLREVGGLEFGQPLRLSFETHKSARVGSDRVWSVCVGIEKLVPANAGQK